MGSYIRIERIPYEEPHHLQLVWDASNGSVAARFEYFENAYALTDLADGLENFGEIPSERFIYEVGSEKAEDNFAYCLRLRALALDPSGAAAIEIRFRDNRSVPYGELVEFSIRTEIAAVNRLGKLFREFSKLSDDYLAWSNNESFVGSKYEYA